MNVLTVRLPEDMEKRIKLRAKIEHRTISEQIKKYIYDAIICEENDDLPLSFIKETLKAKTEIESGFGHKYNFGIIK